MVIWQSRIPSCIYLPLCDLASESEENKVGETKICTRCKLLVFRRREVEKEKAHPPPLVIIYKVCVCDL